MKKKYFLFVLLVFVLLLIFPKPSQSVYVDYKGSTTTVDMIFWHVIACDCTDTTEQDCKCRIWIPTI